MNDTLALPENERNSETDDEATGTGSSMGTSQHEDPIPDEYTPTSVVWRDDLTADSVTRLIRCHNLPEGVLSDVQNFQQVFSQ